MASSAEIGALRVSLAMNAGEFRKGSKDAGSSLDALALKFGITAAAVNKASDLVVAAVEKFVDATVGGVNRAIDAMAKLAKESQQTGESVQALSRLQFAARATGVSLEALAGASSSLRKSLTDIAGGDTESEAARTLKVLGISATTSSGEVKSFGAILNEVADKFARYRDGAEKTALANHVFGSTGADLLPLLAEGRNGIAALGAESDKLGATVSGNTAKAAALLGQEMSKLNATSEASYNIMAAELIPTIRWLTAEMQAFSAAGGSASGVAKAISWALKAILDVAIDVQTSFRALSDIVTAFFNSAHVAIRGEFQKAIDIMSYSMNRVKDINDKANESKERLWNPDTWKTATQVVPAAMAPVIDSMDKIRKAAEAAKEQAALLLDEINNAKTDPAVQRLLQLEAMYKSNMITMLQYQQARRKVAEDEKALATEQGKVALDEINNNKTDPEAERLTQLQALYNQGMITQKEYQQGQRKVAEVGSQAMNDLLSTTSQTLTTIFAKSKGAAIASALINTYQAITKALSAYPPPYSYAMAAMQGAMGFAQVRAIQNQSENGSGGGAAAAPAASAPPAADGGAGGGTDQTLFVQGIAPGQLFTSDAVRDLASRLLDFQRDGGKVVLA